MLLGMLRGQKQRPVDRLSSTAGDAAGAVVEIIGSSVKSAGGAVAPAISAVSQQVPEVAGRVAGQLQPVADKAHKQATVALGRAKDKSGDLADRVMQAALEASKSLPPDARKKVEKSLRKAGIAPQRKRRFSRKWLAAGLFASAAVAFLFSGTVQDKVYDLVDRMRGEDLDELSDSFRVPAQPVARPAASPPSAGPAKAEPTPEPAPSQPSAAEKPAGPTES